MAEVGVIEARTEQVATIDLDREELASIEMAERQVASEETRLAQFAEGESRSGRGGFVGKNAILENGGAKIGMREAASNEAASQEGGAIAPRIFPINLGKIRTFDG